MTDTRMGPMESVRFWANVDKSGECWEWAGTRNKQGYGVVTAFGCRSAHRASWTEANGPIPRGMVICHKCDNPPCVRPDHLFLGTHAENMRDAISKGRMYFQKHPEKVRGEANRFAKLTNAQAISILQARMEELATCEELAKANGVSTVVVQDLLAGRGWKHGPVGEYRTANSARLDSAAKTIQARGLKKRNRVQWSVCMRGHRISGENRRVNSVGKSFCRACERIRNKRSGLNRVLRNAKARALRALKDAPSEGKGGA